MINLDHHNTLILYKMNSRLFQLYHITLLCLDDSIPNGPLSHVRHALCNLILITHSNSDSINVPYMLPPTSPLNHMPCIPPKIHPYPINLISSNDYLSMAMA